MRMRYIGAQTSGELFLPWVAPGPGFQVPQPVLLLVLLLLPRTVDRQTWPHIIICWQPEQCPASNIVITLHFTSHLTHPICLSSPGVCTEIYQLSSFLPKISIVIWEKNCGKINTLSIYGEDLAGIILNCEIFVKS